MSSRFEELDWRKTRLGEISLRRRWDPTFDKEVYEVKLDDDFLMSSLFTVAEIELAELALAELPGGGLDVVVGGLGLGYTAQAVLDSPRAQSLLIVEALGEVIEWHQSGLIPAGKSLTADQRCRYINGDFFAMAASTEGFDPESPGRRFHSVILDVDHSPRHVLHPSHSAFYDPAGTHRLADHLHPGGIFALWSNDPPDDAYLAVLGQVFTEVRAEVVSFDNPLQGRDSTNTVYLGRKPLAAS
ncbi:spermidine synthase [Arthrobacter sp. H20]|uniref:spermidine synthase n=1 Tax=Arthrobacter sp. H20 TaxID=1267981 RepID=UPI00047EC4A5|nr:spermidine synthase [Arthrobacter sp. H20]